VEQHGPEQTRDEGQEGQQVQEALLPHLDAAYNLARWLTGDPDDAADVVQEAFLRAIRSFAGFRGGTGSGTARPWLLTIVRHTAYTWLKKNRRHQATAGDDQVDEVLAGTPGPDELLLQRADSQLLAQALTELPPEFREVLVLREQEDLSYSQIAEICRIPLGTVMSRLARARARARSLLQRLMGNAQGAKS
jgi:RNA polymerase sigma-70 factor (ECF subfamily)